MTGNELLSGLYAWLDAMAWPALGLGVAIPVLGTALAWIGKRGNSEADGRLVANLVIGLALTLILIEMAAIAFAVSVLEADPLEADIALLAAPVIAVAGSIWGIGRVFPLNQLASWRTFLDIGLFVLSCVALIWLFSKFRGWGTIFFGGLPQLLITAVLIYVFMRRLYRRAFGQGGKD